MPLLAASASDVTASVKAGAEVNAAVGGAVAKAGNSAPPRAGGSAAASAAVTQTRSAQRSTTRIATVLRIPAVVLPVAWTPALMSSTRLWLDGNDPLGDGSVPADDTVITSWKDKSGNGRHAYAEGSPLLKRSSQNGLAAVRTQDGTGGFTPKSYFTVDIPSRFFSNGFHFITVFRTWRAGLAPYNGLNTPINRQEAFNQYWNQRWINGNPLYTDLWEIDYALALENATTAQKTAKTTILQNIIRPTTGGRFGYSEFVNGTPMAFQGGAGVGQSITYTDTVDTALQIGWRPADNLRCNGYFCEILVFNTTLSTDERHRLEGYLAWKWGLVGNLPVGHPYKAFSPVL